jgi:small subunit ribosomal protein S16
MSVTIRLARTGRKNLPAYKIIVANTRSKRNGLVLDTIGSYNPTEKPEVLKVNQEKYKLWQSRGALISESVTKLLDGTYKYVLYPSARKLKLAEKKKALRGESA